MVEAVKPIDVKETILPNVSSLGFSSLAIKEFKDSPSSIHPTPLTKTYPSSKPSLDPIQKTLQFYVDTLEPQVDAWNRAKEKEIEKICNSIQKTHQEEDTELQKASLASKETTFWGILEDIGNSLTSTVSFFFGFSALSTGGATALGGTLIISGILSLSHLACKHTNIWNYIVDQMTEDPTVKQAMKTYFPPALGITAAAMGIYGSFAAWNYAAQTGTNQILSLLEGTTNIAVGLMAYKKGTSFSDLQYTTANLITIHSKIDFSTIDMENFITEIKTFHEKQNQTHTILEKIIEETKQAIQIIQQPV